MKSVCSKLMMILLAVACCTLVSCKKEKVEKDTASTPTEEPTPTPTPTPTPVSAFIGTYDLEVVTDSVGVDDGEDVNWYSREYYEERTGKSEPTRYGTLTITQGSSENTFHVVGVVLVGSNNVEYYNTTATLDSAGSLVLEPSCVGGDQTDKFTYGKIINQQPLVFRTERHYMFYNLDCGYIFTNTATKR